MDVEHPPGHKQQKPVSLHIPKGEVTLPPSAPSTVNSSPARHWVSTCWRLYWFDLWVLYRQPQLL